MTTKIAEETKKELERLIRYISKIKNNEKINDETINYSVIIGEKILKNLHIIRMMKVEEEKTPLARD